jgi:large subunit ribosomal protein L21
MYAIVDIAGQQFKVEKGRKVFVHRLDAIEGSTVEINKVLLVDNGGKVTVGAPLVDGYRVALKVIEHLKGEKVIVFKKKRRKTYQKSNGHRQFLTEVLVQGILGAGEKLKAEDNVEVKKRTPRVTAPKVKAVKEVKAEEVVEVVEEKPKAKRATKKAAPKAEAGEEATAAPKKRAPRKKSEE